MADKKISQLTDGTSFQTGDEAVVNRSGTNFKVDPTQFGSSIDVTGSVTADGLAVDTDTLYVNAATNRVGIGTTTPSVELEVVDTTGSSIIRAIGDSGGTTVTAQMVASTSGSAIFGTATNHPTVLFANNSEKVRIDTNGNVGIGTSSPGSIFHTVGGNGVRFDGDGGANTARLQIQPGSSPSDGTIITSTYSGTGSYGPIKFSAGGSEVVRIDSSGNVGIGTTSPATALDVVGTVTADGLAVDATEVDFSASFVNLNMFELDQTDLNSRFRQNNGFLNIQTISDDKLTAKQRLVIDHSTGDISFYEDTGTTAKLRWDASAESLGIGTTSPSQALDVIGNIEVSGGVYLGGTGAANLLDDYEEGTFTPVVADATTGGNTGSATTAGYYTKVGRVVTLNFSLDDIDTTGMTAGNVLYIRGLPFAAKSDTDLNSCPSGGVYTNYVTLAAGEITMVFDVLDGESHGALRTMTSGAVAGAISVGDLASGTANLRISMTYTV